MVKGKTSSATKGKAAKASQSQNKPSAEGLRRSTRAVVIAPPPKKKEPDVAPAKKKKPTARGSKVSTSKSATRNGKKKVVVKKGKTAAAKKKKKGKAKVKTEKEDKPPKPPKIPPYRNLKQNLYRPPLQRPAFNPIEDADECNCDPNKGDGDCGPSCQNRQLYM